MTLVAPMMAMGLDHDLGAPMMAMGPDAVRVWVWSMSKSNPPHPYICTLYIFLCNVLYMKFY